MKNKMGFTILEILAVIVIIATITAIAVPSIFKITNKSKTRLYCSKLEIVQKSAERYADDNSLDNTCEIDGTEYNCENITIQDLINGNYIDADGVDGAFLDPRDKLAINTTGVVVYEKNSRNYAYIEDDDCPSLITNILTPTELTNVKHSLIVVLSGATWNGTSPVTLRETETLFVNNPSKSGYEFTGWSLSGTGSTLNGNTFTMGTANATLTANWLAGERTLTVNTNGGVWSGTTPQSVLVGNSVTINNPTKAGYAFLGWTITGTGSTINGTTFTMGDGNATLSANWTTTTPYTFAYTGGSQSFTAPAAGYYNIELWGAQSGNSGTSYGGYTSGYLYMAQGATYYIYVGGIGNGGCVTGAGGGYNGGGNSGTTGCSRGGGGATDIRLVGGAWNDTTGLNSRIMVAAGGGSGENNIGGAGGGLIGGPNNAGSYSTQISGSAFGYAPTPGGDASGAGGGYYGGVLATGDGVAAGGGSSFISGFAGVSAIASSSSTAATYNIKHYSSNYFLNSSMVAGVNSGNGSAKITYVSVAAPIRINTSLNNVRYIKDCINRSSVNEGNHWVELQAIYNGINIAKGKTVTGNYSISSSSYITDGDITTANYATAAGGPACAIIDLGQTYNLDEIAVWHYWGDGRTYYSNTTYASSNNSTWTTVIANTNSETSDGKRVSAYDPSPLFGYSNILKNSDFSNFTTTTYAWDNLLNRNPAIVPNNWGSGYNSGVTSASTGYHARFDVSPFGKTVIVFPNLNSAVGLPNRWLGINQYIPAGTVLPNTTYKVMMDIYDNAINHIINGGIYHYNSSTSAWTFGSASYSFTTTSNDINKWVTKEATFTTPSTLSIANETHFYIYGNNGTEGTSYVKNIYLIKQ